MKIITWALLALALLTANVFGQSSPDPKAQLKIANALLPSLVQVEYQLQHDKGELPNQSGWGERCADCGNFHGNEVEDLVKSEQPLTTSGFLISASQVVSQDVQTHPRFIKNIHVRQGDKLVPARIVAYAMQQNAVVLELDESLPAAKPLKFDEKKSGPFFAVHYQRLNGQWNIAIKPVSDKITVPEHSAPFIAAAFASVVIDKAGNPVGISMKDELPLDNSWKGSPASSWKLLTAGQMNESLKKLIQTADGGLVRVMLNFRSPQLTDPTSRYNYNSSDKDDNQTEKNVTGLVIGENRVLILADLKPKVTARLQRITIFGADGKPLPAKFDVSLKDYGALVATTESPIGKTLSFSSESILQARNELLLAASVAIKGEKRVAYFSHNRIGSFKFGWRNQIYPEIADKNEDIFLFNTKHELVALPIARREKASADKFSRSEQKVLTAAQYLRALSQDHGQHTDPANVPLTEEDENRLAWLGIELQPMTAELARVNQVSEYTRDGEVGAMVTYVYSGSPAGEAGIKPGYILLRLHTAQNPLPLEVQLQENAYQEAFPWDRLDEVQDRYFERIPAPWPSIENAFTRQLTDLGVGTEYTAEFFHDGKLVQKNFAVVAGPTHYNSARRFTAEALGLTVRNLTYEVQRYLQRRDDEPGVVISRIEPGSKASVSGIKPYEVITHINDQPVNSIDTFENLLAIPGELKISIKRMAKGRIVKIAAPASPTE
ncbi:MAG: PDZ domain-containing protein [Verrucomicrobia bacterium]|nr:PDZ domain-containing protein [Verrucomicrobiota bacterium]